MPARSSSIITTGYTDKIRVQNGADSQLITGSILQAGDHTWATLGTDSLTWDSWTQWNINRASGSTVGGAKGLPLMYETKTIDLGSSQHVYPEITVGATGTARVVIEHSDNADMSSATVQGVYTTDNTQTGTIATYSVLDYLEPDYTDSESVTISSSTFNLGYTGFKARYINIIVFVENFADADVRGEGSLNQLLSLFKTDRQEEFITVDNTSGLTGTPAARVIPTNIDTITQVFYSHVLDDTNFPNAFGKYVTKTISKANKTFATFDLDRFIDITGVDTTNLDIHVIGLPSVSVDRTGSITRST